MIAQRLRMTVSTNNFVTMNGERTAVSRVLPTKCLLGNFLLVFANDRNVHWPTNNPVVASSCPLLWTGLMRGRSINSMVTHSSSKLFGYQDTLPHSHSRASDLH